MRLCVEDIFGQWQQRWIIREQQPKVSASQCRAIALDISGLSVLGNPNCVEHECCAPNDGLLSSECGLQWPFARHARQQPFERCIVSELNDLVVASGLM